MVKETRVCVLSSPVSPSLVWRGGWDERPLRLFQIDVPPGQPGVLTGGRAWRVEAGQGRVLQGGSRRQRGVETRAPVMGNHGALRELCETRPGSPAQRAFPLKHRGQCWGDCWGETRGSGIPKRSGSPTWGGEGEVTVKLACRFPPGPRTWPPRSSRSLEVPSHLTPTVTTWPTVVFAQEGEALVP